jgi:UDP-hydrolysing UDP-N-acetyl-D-glucosamine 2-epimerase
MQTESTRRVAVVTGSRADYGLLRRLLALLAAKPDVELDVLVTGAHLSPRFGETWKTVEADGFAIAARIDLDIDGDSPLDVALSTALGVQGFAEALSSLRPDLLVVLGDRYEILAASTAALLLGIPIAHIQGGEVTEGAFDDAIRHAVSKMAHLHFVAAEPYAKRLIRMGEQPSRVFVVGAPGVEQLEPGSEMDRSALSTALSIDSARPFFLVTLHPETVNLAVNRSMVDAVLDALSAFPDHEIVFTGVNADPGNAVIDEAIRSFVAANSDRARSFVSLGSELYGHALRETDVVIGNSSSGIIEAPAVGTPTVNVGDRQRGRLRARSIIDCPPERGAIEEGIRRSLSEEFVKSLGHDEPPYGHGGASARIAEVLSNVELATLGAKVFFDARD